MNFPFASGSLKITDPVVRPVRYPWNRLAVSARVTGIPSPAARSDTPASRPSTTARSRPTTANRLVDQRLLRHTHREPHRLDFVCAAVFSPSPRPPPDTAASPTPPPCKTRPHSPAAPPRPDPQQKNPVARVLARRGANLATRHKRRWLCPLAPGSQNPSRLQIVNVHPLRCC